MNQDHLTMQYQKRMAKILLSFQIISYYFIVYLIAVFTYAKLNAMKIVIETFAPANSVLNSVYMMSYILITTVILLLTIRFFKKLPILKIIEIILIFTTLTLFFSLLMSDLFAVILAIILIVLKEIYKNYILRNALISLMVGFIGGYISYALGILPIVVLIALVAVYDYIAVFKTKHMVYLAQNIVDKNTIFTYELMTTDKPIKTIESHSEIVDSVKLANKKTENKESLKPKLDLGTGDFALPLIAITKFTFLNIWLGIFCFAFTICALLFTIFFLIDAKSKEHKALPALPLQAIVIALVYVVYLLF